MRHFYPARFLHAKKTLLLLCLFFSCITAFSKIPHFIPADREIKGKVVDEKGDALISVSVLVKGTNIGTTTDDKGVFTIHLPSGKTVLVVSIVGFQLKEVKVGNENNISVSMTTEINQMNDVVVVGYGTVKKVSVTGAVSSVKGGEIVKSPATNVSNSLVGRLPGLVAVQPSGEPGADGSTLRIRGSNTLNDNGVLVVVDGVAGRSLDRIDPNSIESVTILKDASAAIYGSQAGNGVILITTKRGKLGKPEISVNASVGYNKPTVLPEMADGATFSAMQNEINYYKFVPAAELVSGYAAYKNGSYTTQGGSVVKPVYSQDELKKFADGSDPWKYPNTDWFAATLKPRSAQNAYNVTVSGGTESLRYFVSLGTKYQEGDYYRSATKYNQYDFRSNLDGKISKNISLSVDLAGRMEDRNYPVRSAGAIFRMLMRGKPNLPAYWPDGTPGPDIEYGDNPVVISTDATGYDNDKYYVLNSNVKLNITIPWIKGLSLSANAAVDKGLDFRKTWQTPWYLYSADFTNLDAQGHPTLIKGKRGFDAAQLNEYSRDELNTTLYGLATYDTKIATDHSLRVLAGVERRKGNGDYFNAFRKYYPSAAIDQLFAGGTAEINNNGSGYVSARMSYFGRINYSYKDKYLAEFVWRYDGSYIFPEDKRFGFFPAVSVGWRISEEEFFKTNLRFFDNLKLRASVGQTGNDRIPEWQYLSTYAYGNFIGGPYLPFVTNGSTENQTLYETRIPNPKVTWEVVNQTNIGFDAAFLNNKLTVEADYFSYKRSQILWKNTGVVPASAGLSLPYENYAKVNNTGFDFNVAYKDKAGDFMYSVSANAGFQKNKILLWSETPGVPKYQEATGHSMPSNPDPNNPGAGNYYQAIGIYHTVDEVTKSVHIDGAIPGDIIFKDVNGDGKIDDLDKVRDNRSNIPTFTAGLNINLQYKGFDLSILVQGATGAVNYISTESGEIGNFLNDFAQQRWTPDNVNASGPRPFNRGNEYWVGRANTYWLKSTDYVRLKNLQFGYSLPRKLNEKAGIQQLRFYVSAFNLLTYAPDYKNFDPEQSAGSGQSYPLQKVLTAGLTLTF